MSLSSNIYMGLPATARYCFWRSACMSIIALLSFIGVCAQPKPGGERITLELPSNYRWKSKKILKETKGIRGTLLHVMGRQVNSTPVDSITITTIDHRYYPLKAEGTAEEKLTYIQNRCPEATLDVVEQETIYSRVAILYTISGVDRSGGCGSSTLLNYVVEGPTALHTIELYIPSERYSQEIFDTWCAILLRAKIT